MSYMPAAPQAATKLDSLLKHYGLEFLAPELSRIPSIEKLAGGLYGRELLAELGLRARLGNGAKFAALLVSPALVATSFLLKPRQGGIIKDASAAFWKLHNIRADFNVKLNELLDVPFGSPAPELTKAACTAFAYAMQKNGVVYKPETNHARGLINGKIDCDLSSELLIQLGRERGLMLEAVIMPRHYLVARRNESGRVTHHIETTALLSNETAQANLNLWSKKHPEMMQRFLLDFAEFGASESLLPVDKWVAQNASEEGGQFSYFGADFGFSDGLFRRLADPFNALGRDYYRQMEALLKFRWERNPSEGNLEAFANYFAFLKQHRGSPFGTSMPVRGVYGSDSNSGELSSLYKTGIRLFGKEKLEDSGISL
jgi:hypothetical protein